LNFHYLVYFFKACDSFGQFGDYQWFHFPTKIGVDERIVLILDGATFQWYNPTIE